MSLAHVLCASNIQGKKAADEALALLQKLSKPSDKPVVVPLETRLDVYVHAAIVYRVGNQLNSALKVATDSLEFQKTQPESKLPLEPGRTMIELGMVHEERKKWADGKQLSVFILILR
jgi:hypothetical protein